MNSSIDIKDFNVLNILFLAAAERGNLYAQLKVESMLLMGEGTQKNYQKAIKWYQRCMLERQKESQKNLQKAFKRYLKGMLSRILQDIHILSALFW
jgi:TPR repeat protein